MSNTHAPSSNKGFCVVTDFAQTKLNTKKNFVCGLYFFFGRCTPFLFFFSNANSLTVYILPESVFCYFFILFFLLLRVCQSDSSAVARANSSSKLPASSTEAPATAREAVTYMRRQLAEYLSVVFFFGFWFFNFVVYCGCERLRIQMKCWRNWLHRFTSVGRTTQNNVSTWMNKCGSRFGSCSRGLVFYWNSVSPFELVWIHNFWLPVHFDYFVRHVSVCTLKQSDAVHS